MSFFIAGAAQRMSIDILWADYLSFLVMLSGYVFWLYDLLIYEKLMDGFFGFLIQICLI